MPNNRKTAKQPVLERATVKTSRLLGFCTQKELTGQIERTVENFVRQLPNTSPDLMEASL